MDSRERVTRAVEFKGPDRIPIYQCYLPRALLAHGGKLIEILSEYPHDFGSSQELVWDSGKDIEETVKELEELEQRNQDQYYTDDWGSVWKENTVGIEGQVIEPFLEDWDDMEDLQVPEIIPNSEEFEQEKKNIESQKEGGFVIGSFDSRYGSFIGGFSLFQRLFWLRGMENLFKDLIRGDERLEELKNIVMDYLRDSIQKALDLGVDGIFFADDWGGQDRLLIKPNIWREFFKPEYDELFRLVHSRDRKVFFHSDGNILEIIPDLVELGVDVLNPQFSAMDLGKLSNLTRGKVCILTDLDRQNLLPKGSPAEIEDHIIEVINLFSTCNGGIIGRGEIGPDVPLRNVKAMFEAWLKHGVYDN